MITNPQQAMDEIAAALLARGHSATQAALIIQLAGDDHHAIRVAAADQVLARAFGLVAA